MNSNTAIFLPVYPRYDIMFYRFLFQDHHSERAVYMLQQPVSPGPGRDGDPGRVEEDWLAWCEAVEEQLGPDEDDPEGDQESIVNDCGVAITSLDLQLSDFPDGDPLSHLSDLPLIAGDSIFDTFQVFDTEAGSVLRWFSSTGNSFSSFFFCEIECPPPNGSHSPFFIFSVIPDIGDEAGYFRFVDFNQPPDAVVPEPASLLLRRPEKQLF